MLGKVFRRLFGSSNDRIIKKMMHKVQAINELEPVYSELSDDELREKTAIFRQRIAAGETEDDLLVEAFATVREASKRVLGMRHYDVQLLGGLVLHAGKIAEMRTGEGKTLVSTAPVYLNALSGRGVHVVTVNDYLARRDAELMGRLHKFLGLTVGCILPNMNDDQRRAAYAADITYGTNNEFGFDYLRDNMKFELAEMVQRPFHVAHVDEVDSILIDEARTPLIISGPAEDSSDLYRQIDLLIPQLVVGDYEKDEKVRSVVLTEQGMVHAEKLLVGSGMLAEGGLYDPHNIALVHHLNQALKAHVLFHRDIDYIVKDGKVVIIDEFTGRMMDGRRYSEGLHQALEAKEKVEVQMENQTLASITFQNYFRLYPRLAGMTGTAMTEAGEFHDIYKLDVVEIPTNLPCVRIDHDDEVYRTAREKNDAIVKLIEDCRDRKQPVLVGTVSIEKSEHLSEILKSKKIPHHVLNARYHDQEAMIIGQAGRAGSVTIATNMAGRGTDIQLGGNLDMRLAEAISQNPVLAEDKAALDQLTKKFRQEITLESEVVRKAGGLYVVGTERHESRRIDNQLRGRSGRQGDPGASKFFLSFEDDLLRIFAQDRLDTMMQRLGLPEGEAITHAWINKALERAQRKVEGRNYDIRKQLLKFDDVMNDQRKVIYEQRRDIMQMEHVDEIVTEMRHAVIDNITLRYLGEDTISDQWDAHGLHQECRRLLALDIPFERWITEDDMSMTVIKQRLIEMSDAIMRAKEDRFGAELVRYAEKSILLQILDQMWKDHLLSLDHLRQGINLRAYAQKDPLNEYKHEAFTLFANMLDNLREHVTSAVAYLEFGAQTEPNPTTEATGKQRTRDTKAKLALVSDQSSINSDEEDGVYRRNEPCFCGSGKKYKHCHGRIGT